MIGVVSIKWKGKIYIQCDKDANITSFQSRASAVETWERVRWAAAGRVVGMRKEVLAHSVVFGLRCHNLLDPKRLRSRVIKPPFDVECWAKKQGVYGILCEGEEAQRWHERGIEPRVPEEVARVHRPVRRRNALHGHLDRPRQKVA